MRQQFALEARSLDFACQRLGLGGKRGHYSIAMARAAHGGDERAQRKMEAYNRGDVKATIDLWNRVRGLVHVPGLNLGLYHRDDRLRCSTCGHDALDVEVQDAATPQTQYALYRCRKCHNLTRSGHRRHSTSMRGVS